MARFIVTNTTLVNNRIYVAGSIVDDERGDPVAELNDLGGFLFEVGANPVIDKFAAIARVRKDRGVSTEELNSLMIAATASGVGPAGIAVRNETGSTLAKGKAVAPVGFSISENVVLVDLADNNDPARRPTIGLLGDELPNNSNGKAFHQGKFVDFDTSAFVLTDQLVLGANGDLIRPYPETNPFTGEIQHVGSVCRVDPTEGELVLAVGGLGQVFGLNYARASSEPVSSTTSDTFQTKVSLNTPAVIGNYWLQWHAIIQVDTADKEAEIELFNVTDNVRIGSEQEFKAPVGTANFKFIAGSFGQITLSAASKELQIRWRSVDAGFSVTIKDAEISLWRING